MSLEELLNGLCRVSSPKGELRAAMFAFHNDMVGKSIYFPRAQNPKTACGSCIQNTKVSIFKWYHFDKDAPKFDSLVFKERFGMHKIPLYGLKEK